MNQLCLEWGDHLGGGKLIKRDNVGPDGSLSGSTFGDQHAENDIHLNVELGIHSYLKFL